jgi:subfamily B ATP-binding cassette protein MsbA
MGYVPQQPVIFSGTVRHNLTFGNPQADKVLTDAIDQVRPALWRAFPNGLDTLVGEGGVRLSGGERQCVAIIREILKNVQFILLDEATSALDEQTQAEVQDAVDALLGRGITAMVIAHRLGTVRRCNRVVSFGKAPDGTTIIEACGSSVEDAAKRSPTLRATLAKAAA